MKKFDRLFEGILNDYENLGDDSTYDYTQDDIEEEQSSKQNEEAFKKDFEALLMKYKAKSTSDIEFELSSYAGEPLTWDSARKRFG